MRTAKFLTIIALTVGVVSLFSCTKEKEYTNGNGLQISPASDSTNPSLINTSNADVYFRIYNSETDYQANTNIVKSGIVLKGKQLSFKSVKTAGDSISYIVEWYTVGGAASNWQSSPEMRVFKFANSNGVRYFNVDNVAADSSHALALGSTGDSSVWVTANYFDATPNSDNVDTARSIKMFRNFTAKVTTITKAGTVYSTNTDDVTYNVNISGKKVTINLLKNSAAYGTLVNNRFDLTNQVDTVYSSRRMKATFAGTSRQYSLSRSN